MTPVQAMQEVGFRTRELPVRRMRLQTWDKKTRGWRDAQHERYEIICNEITRRKLRDDD